ncbi:MAG: AMP-binding protein [Chloroflexi bacterium]|nr:AMP-binding protein [Chloroflexota bacterium]
MNGNTSNRYVLLTGATGFLGAQIARRLLRETDLTIIALVRADNQAAAAHHLSRAWWDWPELVSALTSDPAVGGGDGAGLHKKGKVEIIPGDVSLPHLGLDEATYSCLASRITHIIHSAADLRLDAPLDELRKTNFQGTANMLELAHFAHRNHGLERYAHVSTAYVAGGRTGPIPEADLTGEYGFSCAYELSKYEGECLVQAAKSELPVSVFRPGMIAGAVDTGEIRTFNTFYFPLRLYLTGKLPIIPTDRALPVNIIPVDYVAEAIVRLTFSPEATGLNFHLTAPAGSLPQAGELLEFARTWARENHGVHLPRPLFIRLQLPQKRYRLERGNAIHSGFLRQTRCISHWPELNGLSTLLPYFNERKQFQRENVDRLLGPYTLNWREFLPRLLAYAFDQGFMHRTDRNVYEQLLLRLGSKTRPIRYFDIVDGRLVRHDAGEIRREILAAAGSLTALGVLPGDRVAIVGHNSARYLTLDAAIGLVGAVSVPLVYTSPPADIDHILAASGARVLFVGASKILERLGEIQAHLPVVSFCKGPLPADLGREVISWEVFMTLGSGRQVPLRAPVGLGDLATLRYTSGTTGRPKGVSFQHQHLRWMGQTLASLLPWKARNKTTHYLSFLPMNHVIEGILATYAPYYMPAAVNIYFLEDLKDLQHALPLVRPTIFFSVPRIYEKIWETLKANPVGRLYLGLCSGPWKRALGKLLRWQTLRKAGLNRCAQLIAGSAPCDVGLLQNFRELGIEIHNAYGMTEAPLVTLNRLGANRLGTVGELLPQTEIRVAEDGEVLVRGPQVMAGYFNEQGGGKSNQPFQDRWLLTGDLGSLSSEGSLVLKGRKKDLFKTSYGKYIQPAKVETLLREIPGVTEAMLVGEKHPYCVALLWVQGKTLDQDAGQRIDRLVGQVNHDLSHPEQVKRWAVLANDLSIEAGDLTANLKLKRREISRRLKDVLEGLYNGMNISQAVLHVGEAGRD